MKNFLRIQEYYILLIIFNVTCQVEEVEQKLTVNQPDTTINDKFKLLGLRKPHLEGNKSFQSSNEDEIAAHIISQKDQPENIKNSNFTTCREEKKFIAQSFGKKKEKIKRNSNNEESDYDKYNDNDDFDFMETKRGKTGRNDFICGKPKCYTKIIGEKSDSTDDNCSRDNETSSSSCSSMSDSSHSSTSQCSSSSPAITCPQLANSQICSIPNQKYCISYNIFKMKLMEENKHLLEDLGVLIEKNIASQNLQYQDILYQELDKVNRLYEAINIKTLSGFLNKASTINSNTVVGLLDLITETYNNVSILFSGIINGLGLSISALVVTVTRRSAANGNAIANTNGSGNAVANTNGGGNAPAPTNEAAPNTNVTNGPATVGNGIRSSMLNRILYGQNSPDKGNESFKNHLSKHKINKEYGLRNNLNRWGGLYKTGATPEEIAFILQSASNTMSAIFYPAMSGLLSDTAKAFNESIDALDLVLKDYIEQSDKAISNLFSESFENISKNVDSSIVPFVQNLTCGVDYLFEKYKESIKGIIAGSWVVETSC